MEIRKKELVTTVRFSLQTAALLVRGFEQEGLSVQTKSEIISTSLETLARMIVKKYPELASKGVEEAEEFLRVRGLLGKGPSKKKVFESLQLESLQEVSREPPQAEKTIYEPLDAEEKTALEVLETVLKGGVKQ